MVGRFKVSNEFTDAVELYKFAEENAQSFRSLCEEVFNQLRLSEESAKNLRARNRGRGKNVDIAPCLLNILYDNNETTYNL